MWKLKTKGIPLNAVVFVNGCTAQFCRWQDSQPPAPVSAELHTAVSAVRDDSGGDILASVTASRPHKGPPVPTYMTVNTDVLVTWA